MPHDKLEILATSIVTAESAANEASAASAAAIQRHGQIESRIAELATNRAAIIARRAGGVTEPEDGAMLALFEADTEGRQRLLADAHAAMVSAQTREQQARAALAAAKAAYASEESRIALEALDEHANLLAGLLRETLAQRHAAAAALPASQRAYIAVVGRLRCIDAILTSDLLALRRAAPFRELAYGQQPVWRPSDELYSNVFRLHAQEGRFS